MAGHSVTAHSVTAATNSVANLLLFLPPFCLVQAPARALVLLLILRVGLPSSVQLLRHTQRRAT